MQRDIRACRISWLSAIAAAVAWSPALSAQQLLDRVVARVEGYAITLTDVQAALGLGAIQAPPGADPIEAGTQQMVDRELLLAEVRRFPPPEPDDAAVVREIARVRMNAGARLPALVSPPGSPTSASAISRATTCASSPISISASARPCS